MAVAAGYREQGAENDSAVVAAVMRVLKDVAERLSCFVLGIDHYGKNVDAGVKGSVNKETPCDLAPGGRPWRTRAQRFRREPPAGSSQVPRWCPRPGIPIHNPHG